MTIRDGWRACLLVFAGVFAAASLGCSFSYSSESFSDSSESSSESSSSSSPESSASEYRQDVASYTQAWVTSGGSESAYFGGVADLAQKRGITDWESDDDTWRGIGRGLGRAKVDKVQLAVYEKSWASDDPAKVKLIRKGFDDVR